MKRVAVILSGCGVYDGAEIHEAVLTLLALDRAGAKVQCFAPDVVQLHVVNHLTGEVSSGESRNVLVEAARIARGAIKPLSELRVQDVDVIVLPGGFGAAKNLSDLAVAGPQVSVLPELEKILREAHAAGKVLGFLCISPVIAAKVFGSLGVSVTIGDDPGTAATVSSTGAQHVNCPVSDIVVDAKNKIYTTPAYMLGPSIKDVAEGIERLVGAVLAE